MSSAPLPKRVADRPKMARVIRHDTQEAALINSSTSIQGEHVEPRTRDRPPSPGKQRSVHTIILGEQELFQAAFEKKETAALPQIVRELIPSSRPSKCYGTLTNRKSLKKWNQVISLPGIINMSIILSYENISIFKDMLS